RPGALPRRRRGALGAGRDRRDRDARPAPRDPRADAGRLAPRGGRERGALRRAHRRPVRGRRGRRDPAREPGARGGAGGRGVREATPRRALRRQDREAGSPGMTSVAVLLPGLMGSELWLEDQLVWPGKPSELLLPYSKMDLLVRSDLEARDVIRSYSVSSQYASLIRDLEACGFREGRRPPTLFVFPYDWRKDNALSAAALADLLDRIVAEHGRDV